jgi:hypothetical protein
LRVCSFTDENVVKLFQLTQLIIEYMMNVQSTLHYRAVELEKQCRKATAECKRLQMDMGRQEDDLAELRREIHQKRKTIRTYEALLAQARKGEPEDGNKQQQMTELFKCEVCGKLFRSGGFLDTHRSRRHPQPQAQPVRDAALAARDARCLWWHRVM